MLVYWTGDISETDYHCQDKPQKLLTPLGYGPPFQLILPGLVEQLALGDITVEVIDLDGNNLATIPTTQLDLEEVNDEIGRTCANLTYDGNKFPALADKQCYSIKVTISVQTIAEDRKVEYYYKMPFQAVDCCLNFIEWTAKECKGFTNRIYLNKIWINDRPLVVQNEAENEDGTTKVLDVTVYDQHTLSLRLMPRCSELHFYEMIRNGAIFVNTDRRVFDMTDISVSDQTYNKKGETSVNFKVTFTTGKLFDDSGCCTNIEYDPCYYPTPVSGCDYCPIPQLEVTGCTPDSITIGDSLPSEINSIIVTVDGAPTALTVAPFTLNDLKECTEYVIKIEGVCAESNSVPQIITATTKAKPCDPPTDCLVQIFVEQAKVTWSSSAATVCLEYRPVGAVAYTVVTGLAANGSYNLPTTAGTSYQVRLKSKCENQKITESEYVHCDFTAQECPLEYDTAITPADCDNPFGTIRIMNVTGNTGSYTIEIKDQTATVVASSTDADLIFATADPVSYTVCISDNLCTERFGVAVTNSCACPAPENVEVQFCGPNAASIGWDIVPEADCYEWEIIDNTVKGFATPVLTGTTIGPGFNYTQFDCETPYQFRVRSKCGVGRSEWVLVTFSTKGCDDTDPPCTPDTITPYVVEVPNGGGVAYQMGWQSDQVANYEFSWQIIFGACGNPPNTIPLTLPLTNGPLTVFGSNYLSPNLTTGCNKFIARIENLDSGCITEIIYDHDGGVGTNVVAQSQEGCCGAVDPCVPDDWVFTSGLNGNLMEHTFTNSQPFVGSVIFRTGSNLGVCTATPSYQFTSPTIAVNGTVYVNQVQASSVSCIWREYEFTSVDGCVTTIVIQTYYDGTNYTVSEFSRTQTGCCP